MKIKVGLLREGKVPHDMRVALTPWQCDEIQKAYPNVEVIVQPSEWRCIPDKEYRKAKIQLSEDLRNCDILIGIKEVPKPDLIPGKTYLFFSHTIKKQPHNRELLKKIISDKITLIDYECLVDDKGNRIIGFGRFAGIVGAYNSIRAYGLKYKIFLMKPAQQCEHKADLFNELQKAQLENIKMVITGGGRVANGAMETLGAMKIQRVTPYELLMFNYSEPVYAQIHSSDYNVHKDGRVWNSEHFYRHPEEYISTFKKFSQKCDMLIHCAFWNPNAPRLFTFDEMAQPDFKIKIIGDITCDINGSIPSTTKATSIDNPYFEYDAFNRVSMEEISEKTITTMAVDNLPCSLPRDASRDFGRELIEKVFPSLFSEQVSELIQRASITSNGALTNRFSYLSDYVNQ